MVDKYRLYIRGFSSSVSRFAYHLKSSPEFASFIQETISNHYPNYTNPNRIIFAPLHRIPYYVQHIKMLDEITDKEHPDHYHLTSSLKQLKQFVKKINLLVKKNKTDENGNSSNITNTQHEAEINGDESARLRTPSQYAINFASPLTVKPPTVKVTANVKVESALPESECYDISTNDSKPTLPTDGKMDSVKSVDSAISPAKELINDKEPVLDAKTEPETDGAINNHRKWKDYDEDTQSTLSSLNDDSVDDIAKHPSSTISESSSDDDGEDLSQEELELINKQLSNNKRLDASFLGSNLKSPQRTPSFGVYGDYDWKGEGGEYVPSAIEMNILHVDNSQDRWKNNPAFQLETMKQSEKTESEYHTSDDEPIPFNSPMYNDIESTVMKRHLGLDKRRRSSLGDLMVIPPLQIDKSLLIHWDNNMDSTSDDTQDENADRRDSVTAEKQFTEVSNQRRKFGMRRRRSIDAINPSDGGQMVGGLSTNREPVSSPRVSWADDKTTKGGNGRPNGKESTLVKHSFTSVFKRVSTTTSDERASKGNHEQHVPQDVMQQLTDIARIIVESSEKHKEPCSDV
ncbi:hypothetical protein BSL78_07931 [Apostichopus japonicus]|uniref:DH domain-containing protein n=1 Tax=Stichopus japonicus TaxID=307972 RepID=A0A2G8L4M7_STIJA|nr:hypothetical protein BSL78_07931 [Apostichopus japonicus]